MKTDNGGDAGAPAAAVEEVASAPPGVEVVSTDAVFTEDDLINTPNFKKSKNIKVEGLDEATGAVYGFFGPDPYDRREFEARFYPDHETAITVGVDFANEATGPDAVIAKDVQRWDEGLVQRRACSGNTRGSHHSGKCDNAKYGDYVVAGNLVLLCQGKDSQTLTRQLQRIDGSSAIAVRSARLGQQPIVSNVLLIIGAMAACALVSVVGCGDVGSDYSFASGDYEIVGRATSVPSTATPAPVVEETWTDRAAPTSGTR